MEYKIDFQRGMRNILIMYKGKKAKVCYTL